MGRINTLLRSGRRHGKVAKLKVRANFAPSGIDDPDPAGAIPQFQGQDGADIPRSDTKYQRQHVDKSNTSGNPDEE